MDRPEKLAFSNEASFTFLRGEILIPFAIVSITFIAVLVTREATLTELTLPIAAMSVGGFGWAGLLGVITWGYRFGEKRAINRMFAGEFWECWQLSSSAWQALVEAECNLISPPDEGQKAYVGAVYSSIVGFILSVILIAVGVFVVEEPELKSGMWFSAAAVFLISLGAGLFQPMVARYNANRYRRKSLRVAEPRIWFAPDDIYHEALGHTSLKELEKVTDQTKSRNAIRFTLTASTESSDYLVSYPFPVPSGCEERAGRLVRRYRQEHLHK